MNPAERLFLERYINNPGRNLLRFSFIFMVLGIVLSVGILSAALNLFEGYERALRSTLLDSVPQISVQSNTRDHLDDAQVESALSLLKSQPEIVSAVPVVSLNLMSHNGSKVRGSVMRAYQYQKGEVPAFVKYLKEGNVALSPGKVIVGHYLAKELGLSLGDTLRTVYPQLDRITPLGMYPGENSFIITGIYSSGYYEYDRTLIIGSVQDARSILQSSGGFNSIELKLGDKYLDKATQIANQYDVLLGEDISAVPIANTSLFRLVRMQKWMIFIIFCFLVLIAGINVISGVSTLILDRRNEIAILKALGANPPTIRNILGNQMLLVCLISVIIGQLFGMLLSWLVVKQNFYHLKGDVYFIDRLELYVSPFNQALIFVVAAMFIMLCIRLPLRRIDRMLVIDLLRNP